MEKSIFFATYGGQCYTKAYGGRKLYKKAIRLSNVMDENKNLISKEIIVSLSKAFSNCPDKLTYRDNIEFEAVLTSDNRLLYLSNIKKL